MAALLLNIRAPPTPCRALYAIICRAAAAPVPGVRPSRSDAAVNTAAPSVNARPLPYMSERRPAMATRTATVKG